MDMVAIFVMWPRSDNHRCSILNLSSVGVVATKENMLKHTDDLG